MLRDVELPTSTRYMAAWVAVELGDRGAAVDGLIREVQSESEWSLPAAVALARGGVTRAIPAVLDVMRRVDLTDDVRAIGYATVLRDLGGDLPADIRDRLAGAASGWVIRMINDDFPA